ncbi:MAG: PilC/PilY family type IV pilus protein, partial [Burkholderiales bacterium]|nr:PilC/PilY family type IV pilus protein [Burkholderiales bacterium]
RGASSSALASSISSTESITGTHIYRAAFYANDWSGTLSAHRLDEGGAPSDEPDWEASFPTWTARKIYTWNNGGKPFEHAHLLQKAVFDANAGSLDKTAVINWLKGDRSQEGTTLRRRERLMGDIVNSDPLYVGDENFLHMPKIPEEGKSYLAFVASKKDRPKMVYVGANDGMVHAFAAGPGKDGNLCGASRLGEEVFAYVPGTVTGRLPNLAKKDYKHEFYADGPLYAGDAYLDLGDGAKWRTILVGGLGNGGRALYALDVTNPCETDASKKVLWEFADPDLGYTHARPVIGRLNNGQWAAIAGNGPNSDSRHAVLFILDLKTGALIRKIDVDGAATGIDNGLFAPTLSDVNGDGVVDYVYAGDNLGRLWKFDLSSANPTDWKVADLKDASGGTLTGQPLFSTGGEPITAAPRLADPPPGVDGVMLYFGSGRFIAEEDKTDTAQRRLYGVLDRGRGALTRSELVEQQVNTTTETLAGRTVRKARNAKNAVDYAAKSGWFVPLPDSGERVIVQPWLVQDRIIFVSMAPNADPCGPGGTGWMYELDRSTGYMPESSIFEFASGSPFMALKLQGLSKSAIFLRDYDKGKGVMLTHSLTGRTERASFNLSGLRLGRVSWREVIE